MFRKMNRLKQQLAEDACKELLHQQVRGVLSVLGDDGYPYGLPLDYWYCQEEDTIYFHCGKHGHKLDAIGVCDKVSFCVCDSGTKAENDWALTFRSVIVFGRASIIDDSERVIDITRRLSYRFTSDTAYIEDEIRKFSPGTLCIALKIEHISGKRVHEA